MTHWIVSFHGWRQVRRLPLRVSVCDAFPDSLAFLLTQQIFHNTRALCRHGSVARPSVHTLLLCHESLGFENRPKIGCLHYDLMWFSSRPPGEFCDSDLNQAMSTSREVKLQLVMHGQWWDSRSGRFTSGNDFECTLDRSSGVLQSRSWRWGKDKNVSPCRESNPCSPVTLILFQPLYWKGHSSVLCLSYEL